MSNIDEETNVQSEKQQPIEINVNPYVICIKRVEKNQDRNFVISVLCQTYGNPNTINFIERKDKQERVYYTVYITFREVYLNPLVYSICETLRQGGDFKLFIDNESNGQQRQRYWYLCNTSINNAMYRPGPLPHSVDPFVPHPITVYYDNYAALAEIWNMAEESDAKKLSNIDDVENELCGMLNEQLTLSKKASTLTSPIKPKSNNANNMQHPSPRTVTVENPADKPNPLFNRHASELDNQFAFVKGLNDVLRARIDSDAVYISEQETRIKYLEEQLKCEKKKGFVDLMKSKEEASKWESRYHELYDVYSVTFDDNAELEKENTMLRRENRSLKRCNVALNIEHEEICDEILRVKRQRSSNQQMDVSMQQATLKDVEDVEEITV